MYYNFNVEKVRFGGCEYVTGTYLGEVGVVGEELGAEAGAVEVDVELGGGEAFVAKHFLNGAQVGSPFKQMGGEAVAQGVGRYVFMQAGQLGAYLNYVENHLTRQL